MTGIVVASLVEEVSRVYEEGIVDTGKQPELFALIAFLLTFGFVRTSTHLIRRGVRWWPGNLEVKGTHIHHLVWGILLLLVIGYLGVALEPGSPWQEMLAILFGVGAALTLDEFALWLNLRDVYWSEEGRRSIDAVIVASILGGLAIIGIQVWIDLAEDVRIAAQFVVATVGVFGIALALVNGLKGKPLMAALALLVPVVGLVGALRLARPGSLWARFYSDDRRARSLARIRPRPAAAKPADGEPHRREAVLAVGRASTAEPGSARADPALAAQGDERDQPGQLRGERTDQGHGDRDQERA